ncbi:MAG TPA: cytochrome c [Hanamia sp.]
MIKIIIPFFLSLFGCSVIFAQTSKLKVTKAKPQAASADDILPSIKRGKLVYANYCLTCHQEDGGGVPNLNPPLIQTSFVIGDKDVLIKIILNGFNEHVDIDGESYSNNMPSFNSLKDQQIADVLAYIRNNFGNKASPIISADVQKIRYSAKN